MHDSTARACNTTKGASDNLHRYLKTGSNSSTPEHYRCWNLSTTRTKSTRVSGTIFLKHNYITDPETTPVYAIISAANQITETICTHTPINMCEEDLEALQCLETIFSMEARKKSDVQIKATLIRTPQRVQKTTTNQDTKKACTTALQELATQPRVHQTIFTDI